MVKMKYYKNPKMVLLASLVLGSNSLSNNKFIAFTKFVTTVEFCFGFQDLVYLIYIISFKNHMKLIFNSSSFCLKWMEPLLFRLFIYSVDSIS